MCILSVHTLLKVVVYYDLIVLSMSVMGFPKKKSGWVSSIQFFSGFLEFFNFTKPLRLRSACSTRSIGRREVSISHSH